MTPRTARAGSMLLPAAPPPMALVAARAINLAAPENGENRDAHGLLTPDEVVRRKELHADILEAELKKSVEALGARHRQMLEEFRETTEQMRRQFSILQDQKVKEQEVQQSRDYNHRLMLLQQANQAKRAELEKQVAQLTLEWQQQRSEDDFLVEQRGIHDRYARAQQEIEHEMAKVRGSGARGWSYVPPSPASFVAPLTPALPRALSSASAPAGIGAGQAPMAVYAAPPRLQPHCEESGLPSTRLQYVPPPQAAPQPRSYVPPAMLAPPSAPGSYVPPVGSFVSTGSHVPAVRVPSFVPTVQRPAYNGFATPGGSMQVPIGAATPGGSLALPVGFLTPGVRPATATPTAPSVYVPSHF